jgi:hypothetical protein
MIGRLMKQRKLDRFALRLSIRSFYPKRLLQEAHCSFVIARKSPDVHWALIACCIWR